MGQTLIPLPKPKIDSVKVLTDLAVIYKLQRDNAQSKYMATADTLDKTRLSIPKAEKKAKRKGFKTGVITTLFIEAAAALYFLLKP